MSGPAEAIVEALRDVYDPCCREKGISVVDMGLLEDVRVDGDQARVELVLTSGWCPFVIPLLDSIRERIEALDEVSGATVEVVWDKAWSDARLSQDARQKLRFLPTPTEAGSPQSYAVAQGRGKEVHK